MLSALTLVAAETAEHGEPAVHPYVVGAVSLGILLAMLLALLAFAGGREHS
jgi:acyl dehydratase